jgi:hypothetical protein
MHNSQHARVLAKFLWPTLEHAQDVSAEFGSLDNCSCFEKVTYPAEPDADFAIHLELDEVRKGLSLRVGAGAEGAGKLSNRLTEALEGDDHAVGMLWALLAGRDDEPNGHGQRAGALWDEYVLNLHRLRWDSPCHLPRPPVNSEFYAGWRWKRASRPVRRALGRGGVSEPFSSCDLAGLKDVDGFGQLSGFPGAAAEFAQDAPGLELGVRALAGAA